ncbi:hypothetical protein G9A89_008321 [Geosiphon pyriformis]|nr:hypothetical protein G9A89_008321 [Geosiphon pyriformis]
MHSEAYVKNIRQYAHDCNQCDLCQKSVKKDYNLCRACKFIFFEKLYRDFSTGNKVIDEIIKNPIYISPKNNYSNGRVNYYEWISWERLSNINEIARGGFGIIYQATWVDGQINKHSIRCNGVYQRYGERQVAIKIVKTNSEEVFKELNIQRAMFIKYGYLSCISSILGITQNTITLEYGIVMEFAKHGDMRKYLSKNFHSIDSISFTEKRTIAFQIALGLEEIHDSGMVHRNLHSGNILQYKSMTSNTRICDLRLCQPTNNEATTTKEKRYME